MSGLKCEIKNQIFYTFLWFSRYCGNLFYIEIESNKMAPRDKLLFSMKKSWLGIMVLSGKHLISVWYCPSQGVTSYKTVEYPHAFINNSNKFLKTLRTTCCWTFEIFSLESSITNICHFQCKFVIYELAIFSICVIFDLRKSF